MKLFRVYLNGAGSRYNTSYAVAENFDDAYQKVRKFLDEKDLCFDKERECTNIELIADTEHYCDIETILFL